MQIAREIVVDDEAFAYACDRVYGQAVSGQVYQQSLYPYLKESVRITDGGKRDKYLFTIRMVLEVRASSLLETFSITNS